MNSLFASARRALRNAVRLLLVAAVLTLPPMTVGARTAAPLAADPALEQRLMTLAAELRCLVCQNQTLADSNAGLAVDLRDEIRQLMRRGATDQQVVEYLVARYGDFVLYRPPLKGSTVLLWTGPVILLLIGLALLLRSMIRRRRPGARLPLDATARARAQALLGTGASEVSS